MSKKQESNSLFPEMEVNNQKEQDLFSAHEFDATVETKRQEKDKSVTVLGLTFVNDDARREYFREELRKKLPELRKIEGFPIGEDDDIINLSDPPYYTACPNPWLNDFISEWEKEKVELEKQGKRKADFEVTEPYASDVSEGKNNPIYVAHTYHTKVPHPAIMRYILHYTQPGDIVFDGFAGTGMTGLAAQSCADKTSVFAQKIENEWLKRTGKKPIWGERHAICSDISPYASNISYFYNSPLDENLFRTEVDRIYKQMEKDCGWLYEVRDEDGKIEGKLNFAVWSDLLVCPYCGEEYVFWDAAVDYEKKCMLDKFPCPHCHAEQNKKTAQVAMETYFDDSLGEVRKRVKSVPVIIVYQKGSKQVQRKPNKFDFELLERIEKFHITDKFPLDELPEGYNTEQPKKTKNIYRVHQFYTKRNLIAISHLHKLIEESIISEKLRFLFTGLLQRSTKMNRVHINNYFNGGGGWNGGFLKGTLYIPNSPTETSVLSQIESRKAAILHAQPLLTKNMGNIQYVGSASQINLKENTVDYIFIDPPFGANINYSELNFLPESWLKVITNNKNEAIDNVAQGKDSEFYRREIQACLAEYFRISKPGKWLTIEFSNTSASVWNSIQTAIQNVGFIIVNVAALDKKQGSFKAVTTTTAVKQDLVITCFKPSDKLTENLGKEKLSTNVWTFVEEILLHLPIHVKRDNKTTAIVERSAKILFDRMISYFVQHGLPIPMDARDFQKELKERFVERDGMYFTAVQAAEYDEKKKNTVDFVPMGLIVSNEADGIAWLKNQLRDTPKTYQEIQPEWMQAINGIRKNDILPELKQLLDENFIEMPDGKWRLPNIQDDVDKEALRTKSLLREFKIYVETAQKPKAKIKEARVEALRAGFKQCYIDKDFATIVLVGNRIPQNLRDEDEVLLQFYDIALNKI